MAETNGMNKEAIKRLNREIELFKVITDENSQKNYEKSYSAVLKYYNSLKCGLPC